MKSRIHYSDLEDDAVKQTMRDSIADQLPDLIGMDVSVAYNSLTGIVTRIAEDIVIPTIVCATRLWILNDMLRLIE